MGRLTERERKLSKLLHAILATCLTTGRAQSVFRLVPEANGFEAYRRVLLEYEPQEGARYASMLIGVMKLKWSGKLDAFADELRAWELA
eukprot:9721160-Heterocapsa_arctica.AAC.1